MPGKARFTNFPKNVGVKRMSPADAVDVGAPVVRDGWRERAGKESEREREKGEEKGEEEEKWVSERTSATLKSH
jgi:hypothetical protein